MANAYVAPNFDMDTDFHRDDLEALKGSAPALTDELWNSNGSEFAWDGTDAETTLFLLQVNVGNTSGGAAPAGQRWGKINWTKPGVTVTWAGATVETNSGIVMSPFNAEASSKDCETTIQGAAGSLITLTNNGDAANTSRRWQVKTLFGAITNTKYVAFKWMGRDGFEPALHSTRSNNAYLMEHCEFTGIEANNELFLPQTPGVDIDFRVLQSKYTAPTFGSVEIWEMTSPVILAGGNVIIDIELENAFGSSQSLKPIASQKITAGTSLYYRLQFGFEDVRATLTVPTNPAAAAAGPSGELDITWDNGASYRDVDDGDVVTDFVFVYNHDGGVVLGVFKAKDGAGAITGLADDAEATLYLAATSDGENFSEATATFTGTPSGPDFPDVGNVTEDDTVDGVPGTYHELTEAEGKEGVTFGADEELTGEYNRLQIDYLPNSPRIEVGGVAQGEFTLGQTFTLAGGLTARRLDATNLSVRVDLHRWTGSEFVDEGPLIQLAGQTLDENEAKSFEDFAGAPVTHTPTVATKYRLYVRNNDDNTNFSIYIYFEVLPALSIPVIGSVSNSGTTVTVPLTNVGAANTGVVWIKDVDGTEIDEQSRSGNGDVTLTADAVGKTLVVEAATYDSDRERYSEPAAERYFVSSASTANEILAAVIDELQGNATLTGLLASSSDIRRADQPIAAAFPQITLRFRTDPDPALDNTDDVRNLTLDLSLWGYSEDVLAEIEEQVDVSLYDNTMITTTNWKVKRSRRTDSAPAELGALHDASTGKTVKQLQMTYEMRAMRL